MAALVVGVVYVVRAARPRDDGGRADAQRAAAQALGLRCVVVAGMWSRLVWSWLVWWGGCCTSSCAISSAAARHKEAASLNADRLNNKGDELTPAAYRTKKSADFSALLLCLNSRPYLLPSPQAAPTFWRRSRCRLSRPRPDRARGRQTSQRVRRSAPAIERLQRRRIARGGRAIARGRSPR